jgi:hypothetical protein
MDVKRLFLIFAATISALMCGDLITQKPSDKIIGYVPAPPGVSAMPLVQDLDPVTSSFFWGAPQEDRGPEYRRFLAASVKIAVSGGSGSGTIVYYDPDKNEAYVASCGHLWSGTRSAADLQSRPESCRVITWYHNESKLQSPREYPAQVLFYSNNRGWDSSLVKFKPDWVPEYFPIAPLDYSLPQGALFHSLGCDGGREVAHYNVEIVGMRGNDLITTRNSPRPGRSGGGLLSDDGYYVATCWGTSDTTGGGGIGYFTPLSSIHEVYTRNGYDWLLKVANVLARKIPIFDMNNPQQQYPKDYVPIPGGNSLIIPRF